MNKQLQERQRIRQQKFDQNRNTIRVLSNVSNVQNEGEVILTKIEQVHTNIEHEKKNLQDAQFQCDRYLDYKYMSLSDQQYKDMLKRKREEQEERQRIREMEIAAGKRREEEEILQQIEKEKQHQQQIEEQQRRKVQSQPLINFPSIDPNKHSITRNKYFNYKTVRSIRRQNTHQPQSNALNNSHNNNNSSGEMQKRHSNTLYDQFKEPNIVVYKGTQKGSIIKIDMNQVKKRQYEYIESRLNRKNKSQVRGFRF